LADDAASIMATRVAMINTRLEVLNENHKTTKQAIKQLESTYTNLHVEATKAYLLTENGMKHMVETMGKLNTKLVEQETETEVKRQETITKIKEISTANEKLKKDMLESNNAIQKSIKKINKALKKQQASQQDAAKLIQEEKDRAKAFENLKNKYEGFITKEDEAISALDTRSRLLGKAIEKYRKETGDRKLPFFEGMSRYLEEGGTRAEYLAQFLTSSREELKVFGVEVGTVRRIMYGFLPPGTFRIVNKFASSLNVVGAGIRSIRADAEGTGNILTKTLFAGTLDKKAFARLKGRKGELDTQVSEVEADIAAEEGIISSSTASDAQKESAREALEYLEGIKEELVKERKEVEKKIKKQGGFIAKQISNSRFGKAGIALNERMTKKLEAMNEYLDDLAENGNILQKGFAKVAKVVLSVGKFIFMASMYLILFLIAFTVIKKFFTSNAEKFKEFFNMASKVLIPLVSFALEGIMNTINSVLEIITGIFSGDIDQILEGVVGVLLGVGQFLLGLIGTIFLGALSLVASVGYVLWGKFVDWIESSERSFMEKIGDIIGLAITIAALLFLVSLLPIQLPFLIVAAVGVVVFKAVKKIIEAIPGFATGGVSSGGLAIVGEKGPELVTLPKNAKVHSNTESKSMVKGGSTVNNFNITINAKDSSKAEMRRMADEIGRMISSKINRSTSSSTLR